MKNIIFVSENWYPNGGGGEILMNNVKKTMSSEMGNEQFRYYIVTKGQNKWNSEPYMRMITFNQNKGSPLIFNRLFVIFQLLLLTLKLDQKLNGEKIFITQNYFINLTFSLLKIKSRKNTKMIFFLLSYEESNILFRLVQNFIIIVGANNVFTINTLSFLKNPFLKRKKFYEINNIINEEFINESKKFYQVFTKSYKEKLKAKRSCLYLGRIIKIKGIESLIQFAKLKAVPDLLVIGSGDKELEKILQNNNSINYIGQLAQNKIYPYLKNNKIIILPSKTEMTPGVLIEGALFFNHLIVTALPSTLELKNKGLNVFYCDYNDEKSIKNAYDEIINLKIDESYNILIRNYKWAILYQINSKAKIIKNLNHVLNE